MRPRLALLFLTCAICPAQELINLARLPPQARQILKSFKTR